MLRPPAREITPDRGTSSPAIGTPCWAAKPICCCEKWPNAAIMKMAEYKIRPASTTKRVKSASVQKVASKTFEPFEPRDKAEIESLPIIFSFRDIRPAWSALLKFCPHSRNPEVRSQKSE